MTDVGTAAIQIIPSFQGFQGKLEQGVGGSLTSAGTSGGKRYGDAAGRSMATAFASHAKRAALVGAAGFAIVGAAAIKLGRDSLAEAREAQKVGALTEQVIKSTGAAAKVTSKHVGDLAGAISLKTGIDDEAIQSGSNLLLTFTNVRNEVGKGNDIFDQATKTMTDMSAALGTDASGSAIQLGKALNDPVKGITALSRVGVSFTEDQKEQIKTLVESGDTMKAQKVILKELGKEFGGAAEAGATMGDKVSVATGNIKEKIGTALLPVVDDLERAFLKKGVPAIEGLVDSFEKKGIPAIRDFVDGAKPLVHELLPAMGDALGTTRDALKAAAPYAKDLVGAFNDMPDWAKKVLVTGALGGVAAKKLGVFSLLGGGKPGSGGLLSNLASKASPLPVIVMNPGFEAPDGGPLTKASKLGKVVAPVATAAALSYMAYEGGKAAHHSFLASTAPNSGAAPAISAQHPGGTGNVAPAVSAYYASADKATQRLLNASNSAMFDEDKVAHIATVYGKVADKIGGTSTSMMALDAANRVFSKKFGVTLEQFNKFPKKVQADMLLNGVPEVKRDTTNLLQRYGLISRPVSTKVTADTGQAMSALWGIQNFQLRDKYITVHARNTGGAGFTGSADGSTVPGARYPYGDKIPYLLAPGEEVISNRFGQADRNRALLKAINANRMADGGTAGGRRTGGGSPSISLAGAHITAVFPGVGEVIGEVVDARIGDYRAHDAARSATVYGGVGRD